MWVCLITVTSLCGVGSFSWYLCVSSQVILPAIMIYIDDGIIFIYCLVIFFPACGIFCRYIYTKTAVKRWYGVDVTIQRWLPGLYRLRTTYVMYYLRRKNGCSNLSTWTPKWKARHSAMHICCFTSCVDQALV